MTTRFLSDIAETPGVVARIVADRDGAIASAAAAIESSRPRSFVFVARGSSFHAALYGRYLVETLLGLPVVMAAPVVSSVYGREVRYDGAVVVALSQAGRSPDILATVETARRSAAVTITIVNDEASPLAALGARSVSLRAGPEAIAATKTYVAELAALGAVVARLAARSDLVVALDAAADAIGRTIIEADLFLDRHEELVDEFAAADRAHIVSRGYDFPTALEVAIKLIETAGLMADGLSASDFRHGFAVASGRDVPLLAFRPEGAAGVTVDDALADAARRGASPWVVGGPSVAGRSRALPLGHGLPAELGPLASVIPGQLLAERVARARGRDPDHPDGLQKVILTT